MKSGILLLINGSKISLSQVEAIVREAEAKGCILGSHFRVNEEEDSALWSRSSYNNPIVSTADRPDTLEIILRNEIYIPKQSLTPTLKNRLMRLSAFPNPEFYKLTYCNRALSQVISP